LMSACPVPWLALALCLPGPRACSFWSWLGDSPGSGSGVVPPPRPSLLLFRVRDPPVRPRQLLREGSGSPSGMPLAGPPLGCRVGGFPALFLPAKFRASVPHCLAPPPPSRLARFVCSLHSCPLRFALALLPLVGPPPLFHVGAAFSSRRSSAILRSCGRSVVTSCLSRASSKHARP